MHFCGFGGSGALEQAGAAAMQRYVGHILKIFLIYHNAKGATGFVHWVCKKLDPKVLQSRFGVISYLAWQILGKMAGESLSDFFPNFFRPCFSRDSGPPPPQRTIHAQTSRHSSPISLSRTHNVSRRFSAYWGDPKIATFWTSTRLCI